MNCIYACFFGSVLCIQSFDQWHVCIQHPNSSTFLELFNISSHHSTKRNLSLLHLKSAKLKLGSPLPRRLFSKPFQEVPPHTSVLGAKRPLSQDKNCGIITPFKRPNFQCEFVMISWVLPGKYFHITRGP